ncbi:MAG: hypothetical protein IPM57_01105 [Oligoflexia bacterium]|nr:hypothetical protein [Oligoflexia bacterium]
MQLLSKKIAVENFSQELKTYIFENEFDVILGATQCAQGIFILLFSNRYNKQNSVIVTGTHDMEKVLSQAQSFVEMH